MFQPVEKALSDHTPFRIHFENGKNMISYNMLMHMEYNQTWGFMNNGFGANKESEELYIARIKKIAQKCSLYMIQNNPIAVCFQEAPTGYAREQFKKSFSRIIREDYEFKIFEKINSDNCIMTLYDKKNYTLSNELTELIRVVPLKEGLNGRILPLVLINNDTKKSMLIVNVHAIFGQFIINDVKSIFIKAKELGIDSIQFVGDFNRDLIKADGYAKADICDAVIANKLSFEMENSLCANNIDSSSFIRTLKEKLPDGILPTEDNLTLQVETRDGILSTEEVQLSFIKELYLTKSNELAPELSRLPLNFLNNILLKKEKDFSQKVELTC